MRTTGEGSAIELLKVHFDLDAPVAFEDVKKKYRQQSRLVHPDVGGSAEEFGELSKAFGFLKQLYEQGSDIFDTEPLGAAKDDRHSAKMPRKTVDGTPLSDLGLGLGPTTNGRVCSNCDQRGYTVTKEHARERCKKCAGTGSQPCEYPCEFCSGTGKFTQRRSRRVVDCRVCRGTGQYKHPFEKEWCTNCAGSGITSADRIAHIYVMKCWECKGTGEIRVWNPVLPKGRLGPVSSALSQTATAPPPPPPQGIKSAKEAKEGPMGKDAEAEAEHLQKLIEELRSKGIGCRRR